MKTKLILFTLVTVFCALNLTWELLFDILAIILHVTLKSSDKLSGNDKEIAHEAKLEATALIKLYGYPAENHTVVTKDGYILTLHRIPFGKSNKTGNGVPVYVQHGIMCCSPQFVSNKEDSLGFILANQGYDVWLGNFRGTRYSSHHKTLNKDSQEYWRFGWDKLSKYDVPATIDYIRFVTGCDQILAVGYSMGSTAIACALASQPNLNNKISGLISLGPVTFRRCVASLIVNSSPLARIFQLTRSKTYFQYSDHWLDIFVRLCPSSSSAICANILHMVNGFNPKLYNQTHPPVYMNSCVCGMSIYIMYHWYQSLFHNGTVGFDYGTEQNRIEYGQDFPIHYNFSKIRVPVALLSSINDAMSTMVGNALLLRMIPNVIDHKVLPGTLSAHMDFITVSGSETNRIILQWLQRMLIS